MATHLQARQGAREPRSTATKAYPVAEAIKLVKENATAKFDESIDVAVNLGIDAKKSDQMVRGSRGAAAGHRQDGAGGGVRPRRQGARRRRPRAPTSSAWKIWPTQVKDGKMDFDVVIATPDAMRVVGQLGQILGPRGLMPNPKVGTVTPDVADAVKNAKAGQVQFRTDKARHRAMHDRPRLVHARSAQGESGGAGRRAEQGQARGHEGHLPEEGLGLQHDGCGRARGSGEPGRAAAVTDPVQ